MWRFIQPDVRMPEQRIPLGPGQGARPQILAWIALAGLLLLFELPGLFVSEGLRPSGEPFVLVTAWLLSLSVRRRSLLRWSLALCTTVTLVFTLDRVVFRLFMGEEPLLYDQAFMLRHLFVLFGDLWSIRLVLALAMLVVAWTVGAWTIRRMLRSAASSMEPLARRRTRMGCMALLFCVGVGTFVPPGQASAVCWTTPLLVENLKQSRAIYRSVRREVRRSPYRAYRALSLRRKPDVYLVLVESYGRIVAEHASLNAVWSRQMKGMEKHLRKAGWHAVSGFSRAPVMGGRSWLAEGTLLMGGCVRYEAVFHQLTDAIDRVPNLVGFLGAQGYQRVLLAPADRERSGVEDVDYYHYDRIVRLQDLKYRGPRTGWGIVPDQYSLSFTDERVLRAAPRPLFFNFHMVSSHAPWEALPTLVDDWQALNVAPKESAEVVEESALLQRLKRYARRKRRFAYMGALREDVAVRYMQTISYDLELLERYLANLKDDAIVIVLGDHQPPMLGVETRSFDTPVHVFARDPSFLVEFSKHGFRPGLRLLPGQPAAMRHEGMFSLLVRALVRGGGTDAPLPPYQAKGAEIGGM